jgi:riboflavin transporter FmnP
MVNKTLSLAGTALLATLVVIFDYSLKYSGLKIAFPLLPILKFDFTGIPILLSLYLFGLYSSAFTSTVAFFAIFARSADLIGAAMKALAEVSTAAGAALALKAFPKYSQIAALTLGILSRCIVMFFTNLLVLPLFYSMDAISLSLFITAFNAIQGSISILGGLLIYKAIKKGIPSIFQEK